MFGLSALGMALRTKLRAEIGSSRGSNDVFSGENGDGKPYDYLLGGKMEAGSYGVCSGGHAFW